MIQKCIAYFTKQFDEIDTRLKTWAIGMLIISAMVGVLAVVVGLLFMMVEFDVGLIVFWSCLGGAVGLYLVALANALLLYGLAELITQSKKQTELLKMQLLDNDD